MWHDACGLATTIILEAMGSTHSLRLALISRHTYWLGARHEPPDKKKQKYCTQILTRQHGALLNC